MEPGSRSAASGRPQAPAPARRRAAQSAHELWTASRVAGDEGRWAAGERLASRALRLLNAGPDQPDLRIRVLISLSYHRSEQGRLTSAAALLDQAAGLADPVPPAVLVARGMLFVRTGRPDLARADLDAAVAHLRKRQAAAARRAVIEADSSSQAMAREAADDLAGALMNRGLLHLTAGRLTAAATDTDAARWWGRTLDRPDIVAMAGHNLGFVKYLAGDLPGALADMAEAAQSWPGIGGSSPLDRARVLVAAGLVTEAGELIDVALQQLTENRATADLVEAYAVRAEIDLLADDTDGATGYARRAAALAARRGNRAAAAGAAVLELRADRTRRRRESGLPGLRTTLTLAPAGGRPGTLTPTEATRRTALADAKRAAVRAAALGEDAPVEDLRSMLLLQADALLDAERPAAAQRVADRADALPGHPAMASRLHQHLVRARIQLASGQRTAGLRRLGRGLDELAAFQARFGSHDLQAAAAVHGRELAMVGLRHAVRSGSPAAILRWLELGRGVGHRLPTVRPPENAELAADLGALRSAQERARLAVLSGTRDPVAERRVVELRRTVRARTWTVAGSGRTGKPLGLTAVRRRLADDQRDPSVVAFVGGVGAVFALTVTAHSATFVELCSFADLDRAARRVFADLRLLATPRVPDPVRAVATRSLADSLCRIDGLLLRPLRGRLTAGPVMLTAIGLISTLPWALLPSLSARPLAVSSSVTAALSGPPPTSGLAAGVLAVAGPDLPTGAAEAVKVAELHSGARVLTGPAATGQAVLGGIPDGGLLHIAAHGTHQTDSPLFSSVLLADGPLYGYDIAPNPALPEQVVLSSCEVGRSDVVVGEPLGLAAALLRSGVRTVVAGVSLVADEVATAVMTDYHRRLATGADPATALAVAVAGSADPAPFSCFGTGF